MSTRPQDVPPDPIVEMLGQMLTFLLQPMPQDATAVQPQAAIPEAPQRAPEHTMSATPDQGWFQNMVQDVGRWMEGNQIAPMTSFPPVALLQMILGDHPGESIGGPSGAISAFATSSRSLQRMQRFADPGFHNFIIKHGPKQPFNKIRDYAPEGVIDDLWREYHTMRETQAATRAASQAPTHVRSMSRATGQ